MIFVYYLIAINIIAFFAYGLDKRKSIKHRFRISEQTLLLFAIFGGGVGSLFGMGLFRHKTRKKKFTIGVPLLTILSIVLTVFVYNWLN